MDDFDSTQADEFDDELDGPASLADRFFYYTFILAVAMVIEHQGLYAPGL